MISESVSKIVGLQKAREEDKSNKGLAVEQRQILQKLMQEEALEEAIIREQMRAVAKAESKEFTITIEEFQELEKKRNLVEGIRGLFWEQLKKIKQYMQELSLILDSEMESDTNTMKEESSLINSISELVKEILKEKEQLNSYLSIVNKMTYDKKKLRRLRMLARISVKLPALPLLTVNLVSRELPKFFITPIGLSNIPESGSCIIAIHHHHSALDPGIMKAIVDRPIFFIAATEVFAFWKPFGKLAREAGMIPYDRKSMGEMTFFHKFMIKKVKAYGTDNRKSMIDTLNHLQAGDIIGIFPEGDSKTFFPTYKRLKGEEFLPPNSGYVQLSVMMKKKYHVDVPIIPVGLRYKGFTIRVIVGKPIHITDDVKGMNEQQQKAFIEDESNRIFEEIKRLSS